MELDLRNREGSESMPKRQTSAGQVSIVPQRHTRPPTVKRHSFASWTSKPNDSHIMPAQQEACRTALKGNRKTLSPHDMLLTRSCSKGRAHHERPGRRVDNRRGPTVGTSGTLRGLRLRSRPTVVPRSLPASEVSESELLTSGMVSQPEDAMLAC